MIRFDTYHGFVHDVTELFGYQYDDTVPDWIHPFIHVIFVVVPAMLVSVVLYLIITGILRRLSQKNVCVPQPQTVRGLDTSLFKTVLQYTRKQQVLMI